MSVQLSEDSSIVNRLGLLKPGQSIIYYVGNLASAREHGHDNLSAARVAQSLAERGKMILTQKRIGDNMFQYIATARREIDREPTLPVLRDGRYSGRLR